MPDHADSNVLIVEDTLDIATMIAICLKDAFGIDAYHAKNGQVAIDYLDDVQPDLILLDLNLPVVNGWKVLEHAKHLYGERSIRVIVTTANTDEVNRLVGKMQYVSNYIHKPFVPETIVNAVREVMEFDKS